MGLAAGAVGAVIVYLVNDAAHGATNPVHCGMVHPIIGRVRQGVDPVGMCVW